MHEIKFRAWNHIVNRYEYNITLKSLYETKYVQFQNLTFEQCSTYKDKNGKEIHHGDNIEVSENCNGEIKKWITEVVFNGSSFVLVYRDCCEHCKSGVGLICNLSDTPGSIEIIGNIHQNN